MRVISMVPSLTETLLWAGVDVVGRTRFCIHPSETVSSIAIVGGTKDIDMAKAKALLPDLLVLDREENPKSMAELGLPFHATQVQAISDLAKTFTSLADKLQCPKLLELAERWQTIAATRLLPVFENLPVLEWLTQKPKAAVQVYYVIWRDPWMIVSRETFIGSMLEHLGFTVPSFNMPLFSGDKYPRLLWSDIDKPEHLILFSSEPYPFMRNKKVIPSSLKASAAIVDGEKLSWFGVRSLRYLEEIAQRR